MTKKKRGRGRPPKNHESMHFKLEARLAKRLRRVAKKTSATQTSIIEDALRVWFEEHG